VGTDDSWLRPFTSQGGVDVDAVMAEGDLGPKELDVVEINNL